MRNNFLHANYTDAVRIRVIRRSWFVYFASSFRPAFRLSQFMMALNTRK